MLLSGLDIVRLDLVSVVKIAVALFLATCRASAWSWAISSVIIASMRPVFARSVLDASHSSRFLTGVLCASKRNH